MYSEEARIDKSWVKVMNDQLRRYTDLISNKHTIEPPLRNSFWGNCPLCDHIKTLDLNGKSNCLCCILTDGCGKVSVKFEDFYVGMLDFSKLLSSDKTKRTKAVAIVRRQALKDRLIELGWIFKPKTYVIIKHKSHKGD